jgi:hypothetical protein
MYKVTKRFNSRDGKLEIDSREYGITQEGLDEIGDAKPHLGGATHIFVKTVGGPSNKINFFTRDNGISQDVEEKNHGWAEWFMQGGGSTYKPHLGESGWWNVRVADAPSEIAADIGLPDSWHISTFIVFEWDADETGELPEVPDEEGPTVPEQPQGKTIAKITAKIFYSDGSTSDHTLFPEAQG